MYLARLRLVAALNSASAGSSYRLFLSDHKRRALVRTETHRPHALIPLTPLTGFCPRLKTQSFFTPGREKCNSRDIARADPAAAIFFFPPYIFLRQLRVSGATPFAQIDDPVLRAADLNQPFAAPLCRRLAPLNFHPRSQR